MRSRIIPAVGLSVAALAAATAFAGTADANGHSTSAVTHRSVGNISGLAQSNAKACYKLTTNDSGVGIASQTATDDPGVDSAGAAGFTVRKSCKITKVQTVGVYYNGSGPADSVTVTFSKVRKGHPGKVVSSQKNLKYTDATGIGSLGTTLKKPVTLSKGHYFVSFTANMDLSPGGQWGWELSSDQKGKVDQWQNQGGGFGVCPTWNDVLTCTGYGNDFMVSLS